MRHFLVCGGDGYVSAHRRNMQVRRTCGGTPYFAGRGCVWPPCPDTAPISRALSAAEPEVSVMRCSGCFGGFVLTPVLVRADRASRIGRLPFALPPRSSPLR